MALLVKYLPTAQGPEFQSTKSCKKLGVVVHTCNPNPKEAERGDPGAH